MEENYLDSDTNDNDNDNDKKDDDQNDGEKDDKKDDELIQSDDIHYIPQYLVYRSMRLKASGKYTFQLTLEEDPLYCCKLNGKHQNTPIPFGIGKDLPKDHTAKYILTPSKDLKQYSLTCDGEEIFLAQMEPSDLDNPSKSPKIITAQWTPKEGQQYHMKSRMPEKTSDGEYVLDFEERFAQPSIKNAIIYDLETDKTLVMIRRLDKWEMNCDAIPELPDILVFALLISINLCKF